MVPAHEEEPSAVDDGAFDELELPFAINQFALVQLAAELERLRTSLRLVRRFGMPT